MKRRADGFSLIEVIIAIAVLAIAAMSLLSYFSGANRYAGWGKKTQKADMAAQSVVEELASCTTFDQIENKLAESDSAWKLEATPNPGGPENRYLLTKDITVDEMAYKARVTLDFDSYQTTSLAGTPSATTTPEARYNDYAAPQIEKVYSENNVVLEETDQTAAALGDLFYQVYKTNKAVTKETIRSGMRRTIHIDLSPYDDGSGGEDMYVVRGRYEYRYEESGTTYRCEMPIRDVKIEKDALQKIYLFYRPVNGTVEEEILDITASGMAAGFDLTDYSYYAVLQKDDTVPPDGYHLEITSAGNPASVDLKDNVYRNTGAFADGSDGWIEHKKKDRIAAVTVEIYYADETDFSEDNRIVTVRTSKGA